MLFTDYIWDFDGTLFDSYPDMALGFHRALTDLGIETDYDSVMREIKKSVGRAARYFTQGTGIAPSAVVAHFQEVRADYHTSLYPGAKEALLAIVRAGGRNFLYSHRDESAWASLRENGLEDAFSGGIISSDPFPAKPAPDAINHLVSTYAIDRSRAVMVGDRDIDLLAGFNAHMSGFLFDPDGFYHDLEAELRAASFADLMKICAIPPLS